MADKPKTIDEYLAQVDDEKRQALLELMQAIQALVPDTVEGFSYGMPALRLGKHPVMAFGATKKGCSLYPMSPAIIERFAEELVEFKTSKGSIHFTPDKPLPEELLAKIVAARLVELKR